MWLPDDPRLKLFPSHLLSVVQGWRNWGSDTTKEVSLQLKEGLRYINSLIALNLSGIRQFMGLKKATRGYLKPDIATQGPGPYILGKQVRD